MRASWQVTAKWVVALAAVLLVMGAGVSYTLYRVTEHGVVTRTFTAAAVDLLEKDFDRLAFDEVKAAAAADPNGEFRVPGVDVAVTGEELAPLSSRQALELVVSRVADTLYNDGADAAQKLLQDNGGAAPDPPAGSSPEGKKVDTGLFSLLSRGSHKAIRPFVFGLLVAAIAASALVAFFSRGFGRLGSPGLVLAMGTAPAALALAVARGVAGGLKEDGGRGVAAAAAALTPTIEGLLTLFGVLFCAGAAAAAIAVAGHAGLALRRRFRRPAAAETAADEYGFDAGVAVPPGGLPQA